MTDRPDAAKVISMARAFAIAAHSAIGQTRKYTGEPYWHHPMAVAELVASVTTDADMIAAAWLHDVIEDTKVTRQDVQTVFGSRVASLVVQLTDVSRPENGNRAARKAIDRQHIAQACPAAKTIKLADLIDNSRSIIERDQDFAKVYIPEKIALLGVLEAGDARLWSMAQEIVLKTQEAWTHEAR